jgi:hypothetical protein
MVRPSREVRRMDFEACRLSAEEREALFTAQDECSIAWTNDDGWPVAVVQTYVWARGSFWVTAFRDKPRVGALTARPRAAVTISSKGTTEPPERMVGARVVASVHDDPATTEWFYPAFAGRVTDDPAAIGAFARILSRQDRVVLQLEPVAGSWTSFDGERLRRSAQPKRLPER